MKPRVLLLFFLVGVGSMPLMAQTPPSQAAGVQAFRVADYSKAIDLFKKAVKENENDVSSWYMLGSAYLRNDKYKDGVKAFQRAVKIDPKSDPSVAGLALSYFLTLDDKATATARDTKLLVPDYLDKYLSLVKEEVVKNELQDQVDSLMAFAEYYKKEKRGTFVLNTPPEPGVVPLKIISKPPAGYTDSARQRGLNGTVQLLVLLRGDGKIGNVLVVKPLGGGLDQATVNAARRIKFTPASKDGKPFSVVRSIEYSFAIY